MTQTYKVAEIFGPTIQGEGPFLGEISYFVRFGGCDYRCSWCDSKHAVNPEEVIALPSYTATEIMTKLRPLIVPVAKPLLVLSGGNPVLWDLADLVWEAHEDDMKVQVETQGTLYREWLDYADCIVVSPKPPSSGEKTNFKVFEHFLEQIPPDTQYELKVVVFDDEDLKYALGVGDYVKPDGTLYLSVGTKPFDSTNMVLERYRWLIEEVFKTRTTPRPYSIRIHPQTHVLLWGHKLGV